MIVADTGVVLAAADRRDQAHRLAGALLAAGGRDIGVPDPVIVELDYLLRARLGARAARAFLEDLAAGVHTRLQLTAGVFGRAVEIDSRYADLDLGLVDAAVMAVAEEHDAPILTFDFTDFRAAPPLGGGSWRLVVSEAEYRREVRR